MHPACVLIKTWDLPVGASNRCRAGTAAGLGAPRTCQIHEPAAHRAYVGESLASSILANLIARRTLKMLDSSVKGGVVPHRAYVTESFTFTE